MSDTIIKVENLGKKYILGHQKEGSSNYVALRDVIAEGTKSLIESFYNPKSKVQKNTEEFWALQDVSFEVKRGEVIGIIGRNGAGKSTLLKILSRITEPTTGKIEIGGRIASLLEVGTGFHPELTGRENIYLNGAILGMSREEIKRKFDEIVAFAEVEKFLDTPVKRYSSGMYVRLAFAVAAHLEPEILIVDEVLAVGDAAFQKKCLGKMGDVAKKEGRTVLFVSHNLAAVRNLCSVGILLSSGKLFLHSDINSVADKYLLDMFEGTSFSRKNSGTRFMRVSLKDEHNKDLKILGIEQKAYLNFKVFIANYKEDLNVGFTLYKNDIPVLSASALDSLQKLPKESSELKIQLPVHLLTTGDYRVEGAIWDQNQIYHQDDYLTSFRVERNSFLETRGANYRGIIALTADWIVDSDKKNVINQ
ncbi:ABC transporter ATP-binding protein [Aphanothece sacrum]|uniref:ABC transporter domain-containing protein n=1 Tax=Aphanothece sacrum FPU1 TaxID=1920663 RepID=A0A401ID30_APHSA|nr:polysaccharide ABC transporter ATP-binding protein [Aphanothece sacrum]GBF79185.1 hypothetical protein AsFPU1_0577 [Aphanothece sacrum FPU1]GBF86574.1 hypothetical protein AsFPU3_3645 [Aphanothece sacrum FPU3]